MDTRSWIRHINRGRYVERQILRWVQKNFDAEAKIVDGYCAEYDIISPVLGNVEVKEDRLAHQTNNYAIEFEDGKGEASGIAVTTAKLFVLVDWEWVTYLATESLKWIIKSNKVKTVSMGYTFQDKVSRAKGYLIERDKILLSPLVTTQKRWFPVLDETNVRTK